MTYKRILLLTLITLLTLLLLGCGGAAAPAAQEEPADTGAAAPAEEAAAPEAPTEAPAEEAEAPAEAAEETEAEAEAPAEAAEEPEAAGEPVQGGVVVVGLQAEPTTLDSHQTSDYNSSRAAYGLYDSLLRFKEEGTEVEPGLAESWEISEDALVYTLNLRQGVMFHDGTPFNAEAAKFNIDRQIDPEHPAHATGEFPYAEFTWGMVESVQVIDEFTLQITLQEPFAPFLNHLAMHPAAMLSPSAIETFGADISNNPVGTGPFKFVSWTPGVEVVLERNPDYWRGAPHLDQVIYRPIIEDQSRLTELEAGGINFMVNIPPDDLARLREEPAYTVVEQPGMHTWWVAFNQSKEPFNNTLVRQAMNHAVNKQAIVDNLLQGTGTLALNPLPPVVWSYTDEVQTYDYNPERAKELLAEAGYPDGFECSFWVPESGSGMQQPVAMGTAIQADLAAVGVNCEIQTFEWGTYLDQVIVPPDQAEYDMFQMSWIGDNGDPDNHLYILLSGEQWPPNGYNMGFYKNDELDAVLKEARTTLDQARRTELYQQAQQIIAEDPPWIVVDHETQIVVMDQSIKNFKLHPTGPFRFENVWIEQ